MRHALTSLPLSNRKLFLNIQHTLPPPTSLKTHFHSTSSRASAQREYPQSIWIDPTDSFISYLSIYCVHFSINRCLNQSQTGQ